MAQCPRVNTSRLATMQSLRRGWTNYLIANGGITLGGVLGTISLDQTATQTTLLPPGTYVYDLELIASNATVTRLVQGELLISAEVTR